MLGIGNKSAPIDKIETVIGPNTNFSGKLVCDGSVRIDGICEEGTIETVGNIVVGPQAKVAAELIADNISVSGVVTSSIKASGQLEIINGGEVWGDAHVGTFFVDQDGNFHGRLIKGDKQEPPKFGSPAPQTEAEPPPAEAEVEVAGESVEEKPG
jgi:cytoskeletal protein CcmA (bactofilin family)